MPHPHPRVVPWRHPDELLSLRTDFYYDPTSCTQDRRSAAVSKVAAWQIRTQLPHTIESTALLTSALVADTPGAHPLHIRLGYSTAICRFVNGLLDPIQQGRFALPMHMLARTLDLPASFVEVRHAATHEALPSLAVLRKLAERGLLWLWVHYWGGLDQGDGDEEGGEVKRELVERVRAAAGSWRKLRRENPLKEVKEGDFSAEVRELRVAVGEVVEVCRSREGVRAAIAALLEEKALVPAGKKKEKMMKGAIMLWMPFLEMVERGSPRFVRDLVGGLVEVLKNAEELSTALLKGVGGLTVEDGTAYDRDFLGVVAAWVRHLAAAKHTTCGAVGASIDLEGLVKQILMQPNEWTMAVFDYLASEYPTLKTKYRALREVAAEHVQASVSAKSGSKAAGMKRPLSEIEAEIAEFEERLARLQRLRATTASPGDMDSSDKMEVENTGRWRRWEGPWTPKPLGVV